MWQACAKYYAPLWKWMGMKHGTALEASGLVSIREETYEQM